MPKIIATICPTTRRSICEFKRSTNLVKGYPKSKLCKGDRKSKKKRELRKGIEADTYLREKRNSKILVAAKDKLTTVVRRIFTETNMSPN